MEIKKLDNLEQFEDSISELYEDIEKLRSDTDLYVSPILFRGQSDSGWKLETTLDRIRKDVSQKEYYLIMKSVQSSMESCTGEKWNLVPPGEYKEKDFYAPLGYDFMIYLRHHRFPSPLLDWTRSHYIASYFAFNEEKTIESVAIYTYVEYLGNGKAGQGSYITGLGSNIATHKRHFLQQCEYTICTIREKDGLIYKVHEDVVQKYEEGQDLIIKYILPYSERSKVLKKLDSMNINSYSLFENVEGLTDILSKRTFLF